MTLAELFPDEDYRFQMKFERAFPGSFFGPTNQHAVLVAQRKLWLETLPSRHAAMLSEGAPLVDEAIELAQAWDSASFERIRGCAESDKAWGCCLALGTYWEPDFLLLKINHDSARLVGGVVCFPSFWSLEEKIGAPIEAIHGVVPGLNQGIGS